MSTVDVELVTIEHLDFEPRCEGTHHNEGRWGHVPDEGAKFLVTSPCRSYRLMCSGWVNLVRAWGCFICSHCGATVPITDAQVVPL